MAELLHRELTASILKAFYAVYDELGSGFLEVVYRNALALELERAGIPAETEARVNVWYRGEKIGYYSADLVIDRVVIVEVKAARAIADEHRAQVSNYLRATNIEVGLLVNFGPRPKFERIVRSNTRKPSRQ